MDTLYENDKHYALSNVDVYIFRHKFCKREYMDTDLKTIEFNRNQPLKFGWTAFDSNKDLIKVLNLFNPFL